jgi:hypothetical protein
VGTTGNTVTLTKATITGSTDTSLDGSSGEVTLATGAVLTLADGGAVAITGSGSLSLPNTDFKAGKYTAAGEVTIIAGTTGDTIATPATKDSGLTYSIGTTSGDSIALTTTSGTAASYTFVAVATSGEKITFAAESSRAAITIPGHATNTEANFTIPIAGTLVIGQGTNVGAIVLKHATNADTLTTGANSAIKGIVIVNALDSDGDTIAITGGIDVATAKADAALASASSNGSLVTTTGGTFKAASADATITKATSATIGSS